MADKIQFRKANVDDFETIRSIAKVTWPITFGEILSPEQISYMMKMMYGMDSLIDQTENKGHVFILVLLNRSYVGYVSYQLNYLEDTCKIHKLYFLPKAQGKGIGRSTVRYVEQIARSTNQKVLRLDVNYKNSAVDFYKAIGMKKVDEVTTEIGQGFLMEDYIFEKQL